MMYDKWLWFSIRFIVQSNFIEWCMIKFYWMIMIFHKIYCMMYDQDLLYCMTKNAWFWFSMRFIVWYMMNDYDFPWDLLYDVWWMKNDLDFPLNLLQDEWCMMNDE